MKVNGRILALLLTLALLGSLLAACAGSNEPEGFQNGDDQSNPDMISNEDEPAEIVFWWMDTYGHGADHGERIEAAINEIAEKEIGVHANITFYSISDFNTKARTAIAGGERVDLMTFGGNVARVNRMVADTMAMDITDVLYEYAPDAMKLTERYLATYTADGKIYGVPTLRNFVTGGWLFFNKDELDAMNLTEQASQIDSFSDMEAVMAAIAEVHQNDGVYPLASDLGTTWFYNVMTNGDEWENLYNSDTLGDSVRVIFTDDDGNVSMLAEQEGFVDYCERTARWFTNGWIHPESTIDQTTRAQNFIKQGIAVMELGSSELGAETNRANIYGAACLPVAVYDGTISSSVIQSWGLGCPITCEEPEAACKFLNLMYTSSEVMRLFVNGEEGIDYEVIDGQAQQLDGQYNAGNYIIGNNLLALPIYGNGADFYERVEALNNSSKLTAYYGFTADVSELDLLISQLSAVEDQYRTTLHCGGFTQELYEEYLAKLESAGVKEYIAVYQEQLDAWMQNQ